MYLGTNASMKGQRHKRNGAQRAIHLGGVSTAATAATATKTADRPPGEVHYRPSYQLHQLWLRKLSSPARDAMTSVSAITDLQTSCDLRAYLGEY